MPIQDGAIPYPEGCTPKGLGGVRLKDWECTRNEKGCTRRGALDRLTPPFDALTPLFLIH